MPSLDRIALELRSFIHRILDRSAAGQALAEYALILGLIAMVAIVALLFLGQMISGVVFDHIGGTLESKVN